MGNSTSGLGLGHFVVDLKKTADVKESLLSLISMDNDLTENEDYFRDDTMELGYESEADRIVKEYIKEHGVPRSVKAFEEAATKVFEAISEQEYFCICDLDVIGIGDSKLVIAYAYGGNYDN